MYRSILWMLFIMCSLSVIAQTPPKQLASKRTSSVFRIDGVLDEPAWKNAPAALGYTEFKPTPFRQEDSANRTEVYMLYSDEGIYIGGYCHERTKDSIAAELNGRDGFGNNDFVGVVFDTYKDKINAFEYFVTPLGEQMDAKMSPNPNGNSEDFTWNAVWKSAAKIHGDGWSFEMFIPFSAIRFSRRPIQDWGLVIARLRIKTGQEFTWNPFDVNINGILTQEGFWTGLENINPPLRLQFSPYFSVYDNHYPFNEPGLKNWTSSVNGGMDVKYGISQAITLDMTLIPDFGQVQSDNQVLNLSPFEVKFNENRSFFTEGTELFSKGNLFYSRRIGGMPLHYNDIQNLLAPNEHIVSNPTESKMINATKISGRLQNGLGIGFFNAMTNPQYAIVENDQKNRRKIQTAPFTNYNIVVLNQSLKYNSSVSLVNTSALRSGKDYDANVTAALFDFNDKKNKWNVGGKLATSSLARYLPGNKTQSGFSNTVYFGKTSGRFTFNIAEDLTDDKFNSNDLGYFTNNNFLNHSAYMGYRWVKPTKWYNNVYLNFNAFYSQLFKPLTYQNASFNINVNGQLKNLWQTGTTVGYEPESNNFYESRVQGRVFKGWSDWFVDGWVQTNSAKKYSAYSEVQFVSRSFFNSKKYLFNLRQTFRFSPKFSIAQTTYLEPQVNNTGFATQSENDIIFGRRNISTIENTLNFKYSLNARMFITTKVRHYWSNVNYKEYFILAQDGSLQKNAAFNGNASENYNTFTVDALYTWEFAPGSFINMVWKNNATTCNEEISNGYFKNFDKTLASPQNNNFSIKIIYFLDYLELKKLERAKKEFKK